MPYSRVQIFLHWAVALLIFMQWLTYDAIARTHHVAEPSTADLIEHKIHNYGGITIGLLIGLRVLLRFVRRGTFHNLQPSWETKLAGLMHWSLYALIYLQAISGFAASYITPAAVKIHTALWSLVWPLIILHILAAVYHVARRDGVIRRMLPRLR